MARQKKDRSGMEPLTAWVDKDFKALVYRLAVEQDRTLSSWLRVAIKNEVARQRENSKIKELA